LNSAALGCFSIGQTPTEAPQVPCHNHPPTSTMSDDYEEEGPVPDAPAVNERSDEEYRSEVVAREKEVTKLLNTYVNNFISLSKKASHFTTLQNSNFFCFIINIYIIYI
jgi:hypothetical protein